MTELVVKFREFKKAIENAKNILVIAHKKPDGDAIGSCLALSHVLTDNFGKEVTLACVDKPVKRYDFLDEVGRFVKEFDFRKFELIIVCDSGAHYMTDYHNIYPGVFSGGEVPVVNIDHHASNDMFGTINLVDTTALSTTLILYGFFKWLDPSYNSDYCNVSFDRIYNDTGGLMHSEFNARSF